MPLSGDIAPATGRLGILLAGLGAVSTTLIAGVHAIRKGLAAPTGSLTQMGTIRLGKRTDNRSPLIRDFVPLAELDDLIFGGWDIFEDNCYEAACKAEVLRQELLRRRGVGTISVGDDYLRVAFSTVASADLEALFEEIYAVARQVAAGS